MTTVIADATVVVLVERRTPEAALDGLARSARYRLLGRLDAVRAALDAARSQRADVVVADVSTFERLDELAVELPRAGGVRVVVVSALPPEAALLTAMAAGARAFLHKPVDAHLLDWAISSVVSGHALVDPGSTSWLLELALHGHRSRPADGLTLRQSQVLELVRGGLTNRDIARVLGISLPTVKSHLYRAMRRLGADNRWAATVLAARLREDSSEG